MLSFCQVFSEMCALSCFHFHSRYVEALDVNQDLRKKGRSAGTRDAVVNGFYKTLPSVTRKLAAHCTQQQHKLKSWSRGKALWKEVMDEA